MDTTQKTEDLLTEVNIRVNRPGETETNQEHCLNPWNPNCGNTDIELYISYEDRKIPICRSCWQQIAESDLEW